MKLFIYAVLYIKVMHYRWIIFMYSNIVLTSLFKIKLFNSFTSTQHDDLCWTNLIETHEVSVLGDFLLFFFCFFFEFLVT